MTAALLANALLTLAVGVLYVLVGRTLASRHVDERSRPANRMFVLWWSGLGATNLLAGAGSLLLALGVADVPLHLALLYVRLPPIALGLWGLLSYLTYLYTGSRRWFWPAGIFYGLVGGALGALYATAQATSVYEKAGELAFTWARQPPSAVSLLLVVFVFLPVLGATIAYGTLWFRTPGRLQRYRIALVSGAFAVWFVATLLGALPNASPPPWWPLVVRVLSLLAPAAVLLAYRPPTAWAGWLRMEASA